MLLRTVSEVQQNMSPTDRRIDDALRSLSSLFIYRTVKRASLVQREVARLAVTEGL